MEKDKRDKKSDILDNYFHDFHKWSSIKTSFNNKSTNKLDSDIPKTDKCHIDDRTLLVHHIKGTPIEDIDDLFDKVSKSGLDSVRLQSNTATLVFSNKRIRDEVLQNGPYLLKGNTVTVSLPRDLIKHLSDLPTSWMSMKTGVRCELVALGGHEYDDVKSRFLRSSGRFSYTRERCIINIQRVQNPVLYRKFMVQKHHMEDCNPRGVTNERILWHGTHADNVEEINYNGFNRSFAGVNGTVYGYGVYFAADVNTSAKYAKANVDGLKYMYLCKVLTGEFTQGNSSLKVPPSKDPCNPTIKFDSVVDNVDNPSIFVIFGDDHAYPEYLITFK